MKRLFSCVILALFATAPLAAGVVYEIETTDHSASPPRTEQSTVSVQGRLLKIENVLGSGARSSMIYRGDRREMVAVDHRKKSYIVMDEESMQRMAQQLSAAQQEIAKQLAGLPKEQREAMERMMKGRLSQPPARRPATEVRNTGERATYNGYPCVRYEVLREGQVIRELWTTDWGNLEGGSEVQPLFRDMTAFYRELMENSPFSEAVEENPFGELDQLDGFPVVTRSFVNGRLRNESQLLSSQRRTVAPEEFEPPAGYKLRSMSSLR